MIVYCIIFALAFSFARLLKPSARFSKATSLAIIAKCDYDHIELMVRRLLLCHNVHEAPDLILLHSIDSANDSQTIDITVYGPENKMLKKEYFVHSEPSTEGKMVAILIAKSQYSRGIRKINNQSISAVCCNFANINFEVRDHKIAMSPNQPLEDKFYSIFNANSLEPSDKITLYKNPDIQLFTKMKTEEFEIQNGIYLYILHPIESSS